MSTYEKEKYSMLKSALLKGSLLDLYTFFTDLKINPVSVLDSSRNTLIQVCASNNLLEKSEFLLEYTKKYFKFENISTWLNQKNDENLTALHISIIIGNFVIQT
jgi:hypothetical protein